MVAPCCSQAQQVPYNASKLCVPVIPSLLGCMRNYSEEAPRLKIPYLCCCKALIPSTITSSPPRATEPCDKHCRQQLLVLLFLLLLAAVALAF